ncbi:hypothetical protein [Ferroplasma acidiphilum]|jgi:hypothetical protein|uniref:Uncharacterized protein n=1 Tax=Ferroplasma acidiphilum TaxID=74969 RepID=A0A1V0N1A5_9ARCH|nr:hypothetical protein [Ferroplasma acidiphilum]ARD83940.1 hypothetical protein FAD_0004 [Ferroplasma acidiphilum]WMT52842.1 MAG: hypothetical protein RE473_07475 [Ferroplasma acidiphilum]
MGEFSIRSGSFDILREITHYMPTKLLISDGIMLEKNILNFNVKIQRIMTPYQLNRIVIESGIEKYLILISSFVLDSWGLSVIGEINYVMEQSVYNGSAVIFDIVGSKTVNEEFMGW